MEPQVRLAWRSRGCSKCRFTQVSGQHLVAPAVTRTRPEGSPESLRFCTHRDYVSHTHSLGHTQGHG